MGHFKLVFWLSLNKLIITFIFNQHWVDLKITYDVITGYDVIVTSHVNKRLIFEIPGITFLYVNNTLYDPKDRDREDI